jgi:raffinose/stachyose/melibiose transport system substrate-binding protein
MKISQKKVLLSTMMTGLLLIMTVVAGLTSCSKKNDSGAVASTGKVTLRVLNYYDMTSPNAVAEIERIWDTFTKANPDIVIEREDLFGEPFHQKTEAYAAAGDIPDVLFAWPAGRSATLHENHLLKDISSLAKRDNLAALYREDSLNPANQFANYMAILPRTLSTSHAVFVNGEVLKDAGLDIPATYDELKAQVPILKAKGYETYLLANSEPWVPQSFVFSMLAGRFCGADWDVRIKNGQAKFTDPDFVNALRFFQTLVDDGVIAKTSLADTRGDIIGKFATNKGAYYIEGEWRVGNFITNQSTGQALIDPSRQGDFSVTVFPEIQGVKFNKSSSVTMGTGWGMNANIPAGSAKEEAAWKLLKWLSGKEVQIYLLETGGIVTPTITSIDVNAMPLEPLMKKTAALSNEYTTSTAVIDTAFSSDVYTPLNDGLQNIIAGRATPEDVAASVQLAFEKTTN